MRIISGLYAVLLAGTLCVSMQGQITDPLREASLIDEMLCRGDYIEALKLTKRDLPYAKTDLVWLAPYIGALFIETGKLEAAGRFLNAPPDNSALPEGDRAALIRERAALLLAKGEYKLSAVEAIQAYKLSISEGINTSGRAYAGSIAAEALLRSGDLNGAREYADQSLKAVRKRKGAIFFFVPRVFYAACLVASYSSSSQAAESICMNGLALAKRSQKPRRDLSLGYLVLAEVQLREGRFEASRDAAYQYLALTNALFGSVHQDAAKALELMSLADVQPGKQAAAHGEALRALDVAMKLLGSDSTRVAELTKALQQAIH